MKKQDILSIMITFVVGFLAGGYLYVTGFAGMVAQLSVPSEEQVSGFVVVGDMYGGCRDNCPSFQLLGNGSYRYSFVSKVGEPRQTLEGTIPLKLRRGLTSSLVTKDLVQQSQSVSPTECNSYTDGMDVRYEITIEGAEYSLDSCGTDYVGTSDLWQALNSVWSHLEEQRNIQE